MNSRKAAKAHLVERQIAIRCAARPQSGKHVVTNAYSHTAGDFWGQTAIFAPAASTLYTSLGLLGNLVK